MTPVTPVEQIASLWTFFATAQETHALRLGAAFVLGSILASFVTLCAERRVAGQGIVRPGSCCSHCHQPLSVLQLLPVAGWLLQGGRCALCRAPIPWRYPVLEAGLGLILVALCQAWGWTTAFLVHVPVLCLLLFLALIDWLTLRLPDRITYLTLVCVLAGKSVAVLTGPATGTLASLLSQLFSMLTAGGLTGLFLFFVGRMARQRLNREGMGLGDVKLGLVLGALLEDLVPASLALASLLALAATRLGLPCWAGQTREARAAREAEQAQASGSLGQGRSADAAHAFGQVRESGQGTTSVVAFGPYLVLGCLCTLVAQALMP